MNDEPAMVLTSEPVRQAAPRRPTLDQDAAPMDGRSLRATGRIVQLNLKTSAETKARFMRLAQARGVLMVDLFEQALDTLEAEGGK